MKKNLLLVAIFLFAAATQLKAQNHYNCSNFQISEKKNRIAIDWTTENAISANYFAIQKSRDGINFKTIALVLGPDPSRSVGGCYGCFDKKSKKAYYRLVHVDANGAEEVSDTKLLAKN